jgi:hypothetical protein
MAEIITAGITAVSSSEFTLQEGYSAVLSLSNPGPASVAYVELKTSDGTFVTVGQLNTASPAQVLTAVGTFRINRAASAVAFGVDKN